MWVIIIKKIVKLKKIQAKEKCGALQISTSQLKDPKINYEKNLIKIRTQIH